VLLVPQLYRGASGIRGVHLVADALADELGL
jgi:hypothetical protein